MGVTATATTGARGDVPASTRSTSEIALRDPPASRPRSILRYAAPTETTPVVVFFIKLKLFIKNVWCSFGRLGTQ